MRFRVVFVLLVILLTSSFGVRGDELRGAASVSGDSREAGSQAVQGALRAIVDSAISKLIDPELQARFARDLESAIHANRREFVDHFRIPLAVDDPYDGFTHRRVVAEVDMVRLADSLASLGLVWTDSEGQTKSCSEVAVNFRGISMQEAAEIVEQLKSEGFATIGIGLLEIGDGIQERLVVPGDAWSLARGLGRFSDERYSVQAVEGAVIDVIAGGDIGVAPSRVREGPPPVEILEFWVDQIFPARHHMYGTEPIGRVKVANHLDRPVSRLEVMMECPEYLDIAWQSDVGALKAGESKSIGLVIPFSGAKLMRNKIERRVLAKATVRYWVNGELAEQSATTSFTMHDRNALDWDDVRSACAFVTPTTSEIGRITRQSAAHDVEGQEDLPGRMDLGFKVIQALFSLKLRYVPDPPSIGQAIYDHVQFAGETLALGSGDCEDTSVLLASCLENGDIPVKLLLTKDHVFAAFETGLFAKDGFFISPDREDYLVFDGKVWIPVETTLLSEGFLEALEEGVQTYREIEKTGDYLEHVDIREAWNSYPPAAFEQAGRRDDVSFSGAAVELQAWQESRESKLSRLEESFLADIARDGEDWSSIYALGVLWGRAGRFDDGRSLLQRIPDTVGLGSFARIAQGNCLLAAARVDSALAIYNRSLELEADEPIAWVNLGVAYQLSGDAEGSALAFGRALGLLQGNETALAQLLGVELRELSTKAVEAEKERAMTRAELLSVIAKSRAAHELKEVPKRGPSRHKFAGRKALDPEQKLRAERLVYWPEP